MADQTAVALTLIDGWTAANAVAALVGPDGVVASDGDPARDFRWASVSKLVTAVAVLTAIDEGVIDLDEAAGPPGSTIRHLLAHASGWGFEGETVLAAPGRRRIYSNSGYDRLGALLAERTGVAVADAIRDRVLGPLGMDSTRLVERPSQGLHGPLEDLVRFARACLRPEIVRADTFVSATTVVYPGLAGMLPGVGRFDPLDWGLGFEIRDGKTPHWTGSRNSPATFGHFGGSGTFMWVDPALDRALVCLTDREYGPWALDAWPRFSDAIIEAHRA